MRLARIGKALQSKLGVWLSTSRPALILCKARVLERRKALQRAQSRSNELEGRSSAGSARNEKSAEPILENPYSKRD